MQKITFTILLMLLFFSAFSQETPAKTDTLRKDALNVYMDASDYIRKEIPYVNYVRDIKDAGVYIISTNQNTGSGGSKFTYFLVVSWSTKPCATRSLSSLHRMKHRMASG